MKLAYLAVHIAGNCPLSKLHYFFHYCSLADYNNALRVDYLDIFITSPL